MVGVTELEDHLKSATHESSRIHTIMLSENERLRNKCTLNLQEFVLTQVQGCDELELGQTEMSNNGVSGDDNAINDTSRCNKKEVKALDSKSSDRSLTIQSNTSTDTVSQLKTDTEADGINRETVQNEVKPCPSTGYVCSVCGAEVPSIDEKTEHEKSLRHVANIQAQATTRRERSPSILINPNNAPVINKPDLAVGGEIKNEFIRMHTGATFPYSCSLCDAKISCFAHVGDHLKGARHAQNLIRFNSNSVNALNMNAGDDVGKNSSMTCTTQNTQSQNALIGSILNSRAVNKTKTTENNSEMTCTVCNVKVQKSIWEQHIQGKNHIFNLKDIMLVKPDTQNGGQTLIDNMNTSKLNGNIRELSIKPNIKNAVEAQVDVKSSNNEKNSALNKDKPSLESTAVSVSENESQLQSISINKNTVDKISAYEAMFNKQIKSDFISFVAESTSCVYLCFLCNAKMPSLQHVEPHLRGAKHMMNLDRFNNYSTYTDKISLKESVATAPPVNNSIQSAKATAKIPLNPSSLVGIPESPVWTFCRVCKVKVPKATWQQHSQGKIHQSALHPVVQIISSSSPSTSGLPTVKHGVVHRTSSASVVKVKRSNEAAMVTNTKSERHIQAQNPNIVHQSHSSAGLLSKPPLVERVRIVPVQSSSSSVKVVKPKHSNQTICTNNFVKETIVIDVAISEKNSLECENKKYAATQPCEDTCVMRHHGVPGLRIFFSISRSDKMKMVTFVMPCLLSPPSSFKLRPQPPAVDRVTQICVVNDYTAIRRGAAKAARRSGFSLAEHLVWFSDETRARSSEKTAGIKSTERVWFITMIASNDIAIATQKIVREFDWEVLMYPPYNPELRIHPFGLFVSLVLTASTRSRGARRDRARDELEF
ncbi:hypothetical protein EVAR_35847_1 [Eumeta japonica]|uniref:C2H2-type domain-containing protein n=1 Tax=Eumeta variegata TaxID=151549 RepID=A0A4C1WY64_EUMVA|nr:hypothetical protein EVAR_35847_1 [Eumeta japonica]